MKRDRGLWPGKATLQWWASLAAIHLGLLLVWELASRGFSIPRFILPPPSEVLATLGKTSYGWAQNTAVTAAEVFAGYALAVVAGVLTALVFITSRRAMKLAFPVLVTLNMVPKVALGPLVMVWFSYGVGPNILITFSLCFFPIVLTTVRGLRETEPDLLDLVHAMKGSSWQLFRYVQLPGSLPYIFSGMKVAAVLAVAGAVIGEFIASEKGLGYLMIQVQSSLDTPAVLMAVALITAIGVALYLVVLALEHFLLTKDARLA